MDEKNASDDDPALMSDSLSTESDKSDDECAVSKKLAPLILSVLVSLVTPCIKKL